MVTEHYKKTDYKTDLQIAIAKRLLINDYENVIILDSHHGLYSNKIFVDAKYGKNTLQFSFPASQIG